MFNPTEDLVDFPPAGQSLVRLTALTMLTVGTGAVIAERFIGTSRKA